MTSPDDVMEGCPWDGYTSNITRLRIYQEETGDEWTWHMDGADDEGHYTEHLSRFASHAEAVAHIGYLLEVLEREGVRWSLRALRRRYTTAENPKVQRGSIIRVHQHHTV